MKKSMTFAILAGSALALAACNPPQEEAAAEEAPEAEVMAEETPAATDDTAADDTATADEDLDPTGNPIRIAE